MYNKVTRKEFLQRVSSMSIIFGFEESLTTHQMSTVIAASITSSEKDFDFEVGKWKIKNRKLKTRLNNCTEWLEFDATCEMFKTLSGVGNIDNFMATMDGKPFEGRTLRLFNPKTKLWSIYWAASNAGTLDVPVVGSFDNNIGKFYAKDVFNGKEIMVMFRWDKTNPEKPVWSQAFSADGGQSWEWNWYMNFSRSEDLTSNQVLKVIELRNYLLKPDTLNTFNSVFEDHFLEIQNVLGGPVIGHFKIRNIDDHFFWIRGFADMASRLNFLQCFYDRSSGWRKHKSEANNMILDSDQVHLLRPLNNEGDWHTDSYGIVQNDLAWTKKILAIDYYTAKEGKLGELADLFRIDYLSHLPAPLSNCTTLWITETSKSEFRHPVIQDKNLLVVITSYQNSEECDAQIKAFEGNQIAKKIPKIITGKKSLVLNTISG